MSSYANCREDLLRRLKKVEGQVKGIQRMVEDDKYCVDVLIQIAAVRAAVNKAGAMILDSHIRGCLRGALENHDEELKDQRIEELLDVLVRFMR